MLRYGLSYPCIWRCHTEQSANNPGRSHIPGVIKSWGNSFGYLCNRQIGKGPAGQTADGPCGTLPMGGVSAAGPSTDMQGRLLYRPDYYVLIGTAGQTLACKKPVEFISR
jgi:hypothetical protein